MPKELIYNPNILEGAVPDYEIVEHVAVGWTPKLDVRIGIAFAREGVTIPGVEERVPSVWMDINRTGINNLIHTLRKARDAAYGRDA